ncbi:MAG TPA: hypothetical protein VK808_01715 [Bacteroidia bacterium]|jgi:hypothetical protein|nr:hypothetical protein [Bacteroidia bacterium]
MLNLFVLLCDSTTDSHSGLSTGVIAILAALIGAVSGVGGQIVSSRLTMKKEERMFALSSKKEDERYFSKLVGEITAIGYSLKIEVSLMVDNDVFYCFYHTTGNKEKSTEFREKIDGQLRACRKHKANFIKLLGEYNYYHKDEKLEELIANFSSIKAISEKGEVEEIRDQITFDKKRKEAEDRVNTEHNPCIDNIINYLNKK